jgi:predicted ATPase
VKKQQPIKSIEFAEDLRTFKKGERIEFDPRLTVLAGLNGCGKSTVLDILRESCGVKDTSYMKADMLRSVSVEKGADEFEAKYFDFHSGDRKYAGAFGDDMMSQIASMRASSGIGLLIQFNATKIKKMRGGLIILDEPDRGLAPKLQLQMEMLLVNLALIAENQVIVASHSKWLMDAAATFGKLYSVEHKRAFDTADEFMRAHLGELYEKIK